MDYSDDDLFGRWADRDEGMERVVGHTPYEYAFLYHQTFWVFMDSGEEFKAEDLRQLIGNPPNNYRAAGGLFGGLLKRIRAFGWIELVRHTPSEDRTNHGCDAKIYRATDLYRAAQNGSGPPSKGIDIDTSDW